MVGGSSGSDADRGDLRRSVWNVRDRASQGLADGAEELCPTAVPRA